jgi:hypothetical protein
MSTQDRALGGHWAARSDGDGALAELAYAASSSVPTTFTASAFPQQVPELTTAFATERNVYGGVRPEFAAGTSAQLASVDTAPQSDSDTWRIVTPQHTLRLFPEPSTPAALPSNVRARRPGAGQPCVLCRCP